MISIPSSLTVTVHDLMGVAFYLVMFWAKLGILMDFIFIIGGIYLGEFYIGLRREGGCWCLLSFSYPFTSLVLT